MKAAPSTTYPNPAQPAEPAASGYRRLVLATGIATFVLIIVGGVVRVSNSGLGCGPGGSGFHGWPFCNGDVVPGVDLNTIIEYTHRALAGVVSLMILTLVVLSWRRHRQFLAVTVALMLLILAQAGLGGATVEENLEEALVAAHLGLAMLLLGGLLYLWRGVNGVRAESGGPRLRPLAAAATTAVFCTVVAGGYMAGTQKYGRADYQLGDGAHHACGKQFPSCNGDFMPFGQSRLVDIHLTHRAFMYLASVLLIALIVVSLRRRVAVGYALGLTALLVTQILVGALNVWLDEYEVLIVLHLALGTLLWATTLGLTLQLAPARERARGRAEAVTA
ncbi:MAG: COX15/CtaA family protein [Thermoleophilaceae bacterium]|nr:COX15/CtaA family protein [Thermoleophilaceae bacterium]